MRFKNRRSPKLLMFIAAVNVLSLWLLSALSGNNQVYLRNLLFSEIVSDAKLDNENLLNAHLMAHFKTDTGTPSRQESYINETKLTALRQFQRAGTSIDKMVIAIAATIGPPPDGSRGGPVPLNTQTAKISAVRVG